MSTDRLILALIQISQGTPAGERQYLYGAGEVNELEHRGLAYRTVSSQTWHYTRLTDRGLALVEQLKAVVK